MKIGILTGGGDCPGLNAVIRGIVRKGIFHYDDQFVGFFEGWRGVVENNSTPLDLEAVAGILTRGGTVLRTSRTNPVKREGGIEQCLKNLAANQLDALIAIGGDDTMGVALKLFERGYKIVGCPKTIDNDLSGTDVCFGFDTAVMIATEAIDRVHSTAESHNRMIVVEVMGRGSGWIAIYSGIAGGADVILIPEKPFDIDEVADTLKRQHQRGRDGSRLSRQRCSTSVRMNSATRAWAALDRCLLSSWRSAPDTKPAPWCSVTRSAAVPRRHLTAFWRRATESAPSTWCTRESSARWWLCAEPKSSRFPWRTQSTLPGRSMRN